jgi:hypothetical protein
MDKLKESEPTFLLACQLFLETTERIAANTLENVSF